METITLSFTAPPAAVPTLRHEVGLVVDQLGPVREWLEKQGGQVAVTGMPSVLDIA
ncbi:hypothetical protein AB0H71_13545 [Nocardia sp. NPDC050697]|uniref:hypothetical protein n=1 Tax=Nocardia sp. NPDC050697 TaxID=3155158 RepID=UPI0033CED131